MEYFENNFTAPPWRFSRNRGLILRLHKPTILNFQGTHILGASRGHLSDGVIFLYSIRSTSELQGSQFAVLRLRVVVAFAMRHLACPDSILLACLLNLCAQWISVTGTWHRCACAHPGFRVRVLVNVDICDCFYGKVRKLWFCEIKWQLIVNIYWYTYVLV